MKKNKMLYLFVLIMSLFVFPNVVKANYKAAAVITENDKLCDIKLTNNGVYHSYPISGKCFYANANLNTVTSGVLFLDNGDEVEVITSEATIASNDASKCADYYVYARYNQYYGYFCNANLSNNVLTEELKTEFRNAGFPESYWEKLAILKTAHPNWTFKAANTGLDFDTAVNNEISDITRNLIQVTGSFNNVGYLNTAPGSYNYKTDRFAVLDGSNWYSANKDTVAYYMDPRNFLIDMYVFQFESLSYDSNFSDESLASVISSALAGDFLIKYVNEFIDAGKTSFISPVYLASLAKQEVGGYTYPITIISGDYFDCGTLAASSVYNFYNIGATGGPGSVCRGLVYAYNSGWTTPALAITGGASFVGNDYVKIGQNTIYFKKWDVVSNINAASGINYIHQYQQNIQAPSTEAETTYRSYSQNGVLNSKFVFIIPVYENMPEYTTLPPAGSQNNYLSSMTIDGALVPGFDGDITNYNYYIDINKEKVNIQATTVNGTATISNLGEHIINENKTVAITVTAQNGAKRVYNINFIQTGTKIVPAKDITTTLNNSGIKNNETYLSGIPVNKDKNYIIEKIKAANSDATVTYIPTNAERNIIATGDKIKITVGQETKEFEIVIYGDVNGDGKITAVDYAKVKNQVLGQITLENAYSVAADVNKDGKRTAVDYAVIKNTVLGNRDIEQ